MRLVCARILFAIHPVYPVRVTVQSQIVALVKLAGLELIVLNVFACLVSSIFLVGIKFHLLKLKKLVFEVNHPE